MKSVHFPSLVSTAFKGYALPATVPKAMGLPPTASPATLPLHLNLQFAALGISRGCGKATVPPIFYTIENGRYPSKRSAGLAALDLLRSGKALSTPAAEWPEGASCAACAAKPTLNTHKKPGNRHINVPGAFLCLFQNKKRTGREAFLCRCAVLI